MVEQGGKTANKTGSYLEDFIDNILKRHGYKFVKKDEFEPAKYIEQPIYSKQKYVGKSIYDTSLYCDFILYHPIRHKDCLIIESKWQQAGGSVDEKYPYLVLNIQHKYPYKTILILDGGGYKKGAEDWIKGQVGNNLLKVFNMAEFQTWSNKNHL